MISKTNLQAALQALLWPPRLWQQQWPTAWRSCRSAALSRRQQQQQQQQRHPAMLLGFMSCGCAVAGRSQTMA
jgi:hypothetical protein